MTFKIAKITSNDNNTYVFVTLYSTAICPVKGIEKPDEILGTKRLKLPAKTTLEAINQLLDEALATESPLESL